MRVGRTERHTAGRWIDREDRRGKRRRAGGGEGTGRIYARRDEDDKDRRRCILYVATTRLPPIVHV